MREIYKAGVTPQQKILSVNSKFGNTGIQSQQGTTRILYDTILTTSTQRNYRFFEDSASRIFPLTNTGSEGNKLGVGDTMVISQLLFSIVTKNATTGWDIQQNLSTILPTNSLSFVNVQIANNQVIKKLTLSEQQSAYNKDTSTVSGTLDLETSIVIPPLLPFVVELQLPSDVPTFGPTNEVYIQCQIIGVGGIIAPRTTF